MKNHMHPVECVAFMLIQDNHARAEQRKRTKQIMPGAVALVVESRRQGFSATPISCEGTRLKDRIAVLYRG